VQLTSQQIISIIDYLHITHKKYPRANNWLDIICPFHNDKDFGNASVNLSSGVISCFRCGAKSHVLKELRKVVSHSSYKEFLQFLEFNFLIATNSIYSAPKEKQEKKEAEKRFDPISLEYDYPTKDIDVTIRYMKMRGFTESFCKQFNIKHIIGSYYQDYFSIPVIDKSKNIVSIEFRKLLQHEYYQKFFNREEITNEDEKDFKQYIKENKITFDERNNQLYKKDVEYFNSTIQYLLSPKVKYEIGSRIVETLWNIDNLNFEEDVYLCEGIGSIAKIYQYVSKNCTCTFGSNVSQYQIDYLKKFKKRVILIPDNDEAGEKMILTLFRELKRLYLLFTSFDDTESDYVNDLLHTEIVESSDYVTNLMMKELF